MRIAFAGGFAVGAGALLYQAISTSVDDRRFQPPGRLVEVGDRKLHLNCVGAGSPTVVLESALGGTSLDWAKVQAPISEFTRVCSYDRSGYGWSETGALPRTSEQVTTELNLLLRNAEIRGPYVLVAHSYGSYHARLYASRFPADVEGIVLVDPSHEDQVSYLPLEAFEKEARQIVVAEYFAMFGILRLSDALGLLPQEFGDFVQKYPVDLQPTVRSFYYRSRQFRSWRDELDAFPDSSAQVRASTALNDIPLVVISADTLRVPPEFDRESTISKWVERHSEIAALSRSSKHLIAEDSDHYVQLDQPEVVVNSVRELVRLRR